MKDRFFLVPKELFFRQRSLWPLIYQMYLFNYTVREDHTYTHLLEPTVAMVRLKFTF